jgi:hypothetical protein
MKRKFKIFSLVLSAMFAVSAVAVPQAFAVGELFNSTVEPTTLTGTSVAGEDFETVAGLLECKKISFQTNGMKKTASEIKVVPTYSGCELKSKMETAQVLMTSCYYVFTSSIPAGKNHAPMHIECTSPGDAIDLQFEEGGKWRECIDIPAQTPTNGTTYKANGKHLDIAETMAGMKYTLTGTCGSGTFEGGTYAGKITLKGVEEKNPKNEATLTWK